MMKSLSRRTDVDLQEISHNATPRTGAFGFVVTLVLSVTATACSDVLAPGADPVGPIAGVSTSTAAAVDGSKLYATTNAGELVAIDLGLGTATFIGDAGNFEGKNLGWTGISFDANGTLYVSSRQRSESTDDGCTGFYVGNSQGRCAHIYIVDPTDGSVISEVGSTMSSWISDIDFAPDGTLYADDYFDTEASGDGGLVTLDPATASRTGIGRFDDAGGDAHRDLEYGGLTVTSSGEIWAIETEFSVTTPLYLFQVDPATGAAVEAFPVVEDGSPVTYGLSALESLDDGRLVAARARGSRQLYEITLDRSAGVADATPIAISWPSLSGGINGLDMPRSASEVTPEDLLAAVQDLVDSGALAANEAKSLTAKVDQAQRLIDRGGTGTAINVLGALLNQIDALVRSGRLTESEAAPLRAAVETLIEQLSEQQG
ncbi:MAG: hypothetical protein R3195_09000 [Gemmatimonadota bacterium]|nr:hypothetical protein [Gemmatimonadota bacterium]